MQLAYSEFPLKGLEQKVGKVGRCKKILCLETSLTREREEMGALRCTEKYFCWEILPEKLLQN